MTVNALAPGLTYEVAFSFEVSLEALRSAGLVETDRITFQGIEWKLRVKYVDNNNNNADEVEIAEMNSSNGRYDCFLLASASAVSDWSSSLQKHVLAIKPYGCSTSFKKRPPNQYRIVGKRSLDAFAGFYNLSAPEDGEEGGSFLSVSAADAMRYADPAGMLLYEVYLRGVGPIYCYPTYTEYYDFGCETCIFLKISGIDKIFKVPKEPLKQASIAFARILNDNDANFLDLVIEPLHVSYVGFRSFLQCLLPPYLPMAKTVNDLCEIIGLAKHFSCLSLVSRCIDYVVDTRDMTPTDKLALADMYDIPIIALYALDEMPLGDVENFMASEEYKSLSSPYKAAVFRRLSDDA